MKFTSLSRPAFLPFVVALSALFTLHCGDDSSSGSPNGAGDAGSSGVGGSSNTAGSSNGAGDCISRCSVVFPTCGVDASNCSAFCQLASEKDLRCAETSGCDAEKNKACVEAEDPVPAGGSGGSSGKGGSSGTGGAGGSSGTGGAGGTGGTGGAGGSGGSSGTGGSGGTGGTGGTGGSSGTGGSGPTSPHPECFTVEIAGSYTKGAFDTELIVPVSFAEAFDDNGNQAPSGNWIMSVMTSTADPSVNVPYQYGSASAPNNIPYFGLAKEPKNGLPTKLEHRAREGKLTFSSLPSGGSVSDSAGEVSKVVFKPTSSSPLAPCFYLPEANWDTTSN